MTTTATLPATTAEATAETRGWEIRGPFDLERWAEGWAVHHTATHTLLAFCATPAECRTYIDGGMAQEAYEQKRGEPA